MLFPISLTSYDNISEWDSFCADLGEDLAEEVREYFIPSFAEWKNHDDFEAALAQLLKGLTGSAGSDNRHDDE